jgi:hypothetical protein
VQLSPPLLYSHHRTTKNWLMHLSTRLLEYHMGNTPRCSPRLSSTTQQQINSKKLGHLRHLCTLQIFDGWELYNHTVHGKPQKALTFAAALSPRFFIFIAGAEVLPDHVDYSFFQNHKQTVCTATPKFLHNWIHLYKLSILKSISIA